MEPTSAFVVTGLILLAVGVVVATVLCWRRLSRPTAASLVGRLLTQLAVMATSVLAMVALMNQHYAFYTTWSDLARQFTGAPPTRGQQTHAGAVRPSAAPGAPAKRIDHKADTKYAKLRVQTQTQLHLRRNPGPNGQFVIVHVPGLGRGAGSGFRAGRVVIWFPPSYTDPAQVNRTYPVIEAFHGVPGGPRDWHRVDHLGHVLASVMGKHSLGQAIVVMPDYEPRGLDTECVNGGGIPMETWLTKDVPQWAISHLRARADVSSWATMGYSAGGWCAAMTGMLHPNRYSAAIVLGAYFRPEFTNWSPFKAGHTPVHYDLQRLAANTPPKIEMWIQVAVSDPTSGPTSQRFVDAARPPMSVTAFTQQDVGHRVGVYMAVLPRALTWLGTTFPSFSGASPGH